MHDQNHLQDNKRATTYAYLYEHDDKLKHLVIFGQDNKHTTYAYLYEHDDELKHLVILFPNHRIQIQSYS